MSNQLLDLFSWLAPTATQLKEKGKVLGFEKHTVDLKMHLFHRSLYFPIIYWVTSLHELRDIINNDNEGPHWLKFLLQTIAYNDVTHEKVSNKVATYKALARNCKNKVRLSV